MGNNIGGSLVSNSNPNRATSGAGDKLPPPPRGYTRIWINVESSAPKDKAGEVNPTDAEIEKALFENFGLAAKTEADLSQIKARLGTTDNPFNAVRTTGNNTVPFRAGGKYRIPLDVQNSLYAKLSGRAAQVKEQIETEKRAQNPASANPNETVAGKNGYDAARQQQAKLNRLIREAQVLPTSFGIPSKLADLTPVVVTLPKGSAPNEDNALSAYIEKRFGGGNLFGEDKIAVLNAAKQSGVRVENLEFSPKNTRVVRFDLNLESVLKLQKAYLDVQQKVNTDIAAADSVRDKMALNQFLLGVMNGAVDDVKGNYNLLRHPLETLQGIRDAVNMLSQLSAQDIKNIAAEIGGKAGNATAGEAAYGAGYAVGTIIVEAVLAKGVGVALSALGKTKAGAEFLARIGKLADKTGELANLGKAKVVEAFSDEAAALAASRLRQRLTATTLYAGVPADALIDAAVLAGNKIKNGAVRFSDFSTQMVKECGEVIRPKLLELYQDAFEKVYGTRKTLGLDELLGGHSIDKHVGKSENWLRQRLLNEPETKIASSFRNYEAASRTIAKAIKENSARIEQYLVGNSLKPLTLETVLDKSVGIVLERGKAGSVGLKTATETNKAEIIIIKDNTPQGWHVLTAYPTN